MLEVNLVLDNLSRNLRYENGIDELTLVAYMIFDHEWCNPNQLMTMIEVEKIHSMKRRTRRFD
jgi:hypothetical protein